MAIPFYILYNTNQKTYNIIRFNNFYLKRNNPERNNRCYVIYIYIYIVTQAVYNITVAVD